ncbi:cuticle protein 10.9-like [Tropilaelaps mercedesae]|uniref:Cuticle protein 10.9-like n=1 Tax=Tropilaelaps mercedesae TaxID=418985 RepID=A0A1V9Y3K9_9ACAR|nr:cuticle protein 10.9-like [Tropilaelaps mercedesae]
MKHLIPVISLAAVCALAQHVQEENNGPPEPYQYSYATEDKEGSSTAEESTDGSGRIQGKYTISLVDGRQRTVTYWADESGFHADVITNELGTESKNPGDATIQSSAPTGEEAALQFDSQRIRAKASHVEPVAVPAPVSRFFRA